MHDWFQALVGPCELRSWCNKENLPLLQGVCKLLSTTVNMYRVAYLNMDNKCRAIDDQQCPLYPEKQNLNMR